MLTTAPFTVTDYGFDKYARAYLPDYEQLFRAVALQIVNHDKTNSQDVAETLEQPPVVVEHIFAELESKNYIKAFWASEGRAFIIQSLPEMRRWLQSA
jgi:hypothetical protein